MKVLMISRTNSSFQESVDVPVLKQISLALIVSAINLILPIMINLMTAFESYKNPRHTLYIAVFRWVQNDNISLEEPTNGSDSICKTTSSVSNPRTRTNLQPPQHGGAVCDPGLGQNTYWPPQSSIIFRSFPEPDIFLHCCLLNDRRRAAHALSKSIVHLFFLCSRASYSFSTSDERQRSSKFWSYLSLFFVPWQCDLERQVSAMLYLL